MAGKKILLVDYDLRSLEAMAELFASSRYEILKAVDGANAWEIYQVQSPDLVILEAILPKIHGFDLTRRIVQDSKGRVPVIIVTGLYRGPQYRHEALTSIGASEYFEKPCPPENLIRAVQTLFAEEADPRLDLPSSEEVRDRLGRLIKPFPQP